MEIEKPQTWRPRKVKSCRTYLPNNVNDFGSEHVSFYGDQLKVTVTKSAHVVNKWIHETKLIYGMRRLIIGLDIEWLPNLHPEEGEDHPVATLQLCIDRRCLIFQLLHRDCMPAFLTCFLRDVNHCFVGVGVADDAKKLFLHHGLVVSRTMDLNQLACWVFKNPDFLRVGLKRMAKAILRKDMAKPRDITLSKWDAEVLCFEQIEYAAIDAFVSSEIAKVLSFGCYYR